MHERVPTGQMKCQCVYGIAIPIFITSDITNIRDVVILRMHFFSLHRNNVARKMTK